MSDIYTALAAVMEVLQSRCQARPKRAPTLPFSRHRRRGQRVGPVLRKHRVVVVPTVEHVTYDTSGPRPRPVNPPPPVECWPPTPSMPPTGPASTPEWLPKRGTRRQGRTSAMSVAFRTALLQALALPTDEPDPRLTDL